MGCDPEVNLQWRYGIDFLVKIDRKHASICALKICTKLCGYNYCYLVDKHGPIGLIWGSKYEDGQISRSSISYFFSCLQDSKTAFLFQMRPIVFELWSFKGQRQILDLYRGKKVKLLQFRRTRCQIAPLY